MIHSNFDGKALSCLIVFARLGTQCGTSSLNATDPTSVEGRNAKQGRSTGLSTGTPLNAWRHLDADGQNEVWLALGGFVSLSCHLV